MTLPIDIFRIDGDGPRWLQAAASLDEARAHISRLAVGAPGEYLVMNQVTGRKVVIQASSEIETHAIAPTDGVGASSTDRVRPAES